MCIITGNEHQFTGHCLIPLDPFIGRHYSQKWNELSETEKEKYKDIYNNNMKEYKADDTVKEIEQLKNEIEELLADRPTHYKNNWSFQMADGLRTTKGMDIIEYVDIVTG